MYQTPSLPNCPQCGCSDVEHLGNARSKRYVCVEGHRFEVPQRRGMLARLRRKPAVKPESANCSNCSEPVAPQAEECKYCGRVGPYRWDYS